MGGAGDKQDARNLLWPRTKTSGILFDRCISGIPYFPFPKWERFSPANRTAILRDLKIKIKEEGEEIVCFVENVRIC